MSMTDPTEPARARTSYESLRLRCAELGIALWHCDPSGAVVAAPIEAPDDILAQVASAAASICRVQSPCVMPLEIISGRWVVPIEDRQGSRRIAMNLALIETTDSQFLDRAARVLRWSFDDILRAERDGKTLEQFSEKLAQAYEETNMLYRMARLLNSESDPSKAVAAIGNQLQQVLPFRWLAIRFSDQANGVRDLAGTMLIAGAPPVDDTTIKGLSDHLLRPPLKAVPPRSHRALLLDPSKDLLAEAVNGQILAEHITHDDRVIG
ncbi:MAG TPA: hypothetical protein VH518_21375, partial [Tepidisphaeraceae bacterium]